MANHLYKRTRPPMAQDFNPGLWSCHTGLQAQPCNGEGFYVTPTPVAVCYSGFLTALGNNVDGLFSLLKRSIAITFPNREVV